MISVWTCANIFLHFFLYLVLVLVVDFFCGALPPLRFDHLKMQVFGFLECRRHVLVSTTKVLPYRKNRCCRGIRDVVQPFFHRFGPFGP